MPTPEIERAALLREWPEVRGLQVVVMETAEQPRTVRLAIVGGPCGSSDVAEIDATDPGARARAISLGEIVHDTLQAAEMAWADEVQS